MSEHQSRICNIILAAGKLSARDRATALTQSDPLTLINGRPAISWIVQSVSGADECSTILVSNAADTDLIEFIKRRWQNYPNFHLVLLSNPSSILKSLKVGLDYAMHHYGADLPVRIMLGDTILLGDTSFQADSIYVSEFEHDSSSWCVVPKNISTSQLAFFDKNPQLSPMEFQALVGRYEFSGTHLLYKSLELALELNETEMSAVLLQYNGKIPLNYVNVNPANWIDCGHLEGIATAKQKLVVSRHFNSFEIDPILPVITKKSVDSCKLQQEIFWYENIPQEFQSLTPRILGVGMDHIKMEYYGYGNLAEKLVYYDLPNNFWAYVLERLFTLVKLFESEYAANLRKYANYLKSVDFANMYRTKIFERMDMLMSQHDFWDRTFAIDHIEINGKDYVNVPALMQDLEARLQNITHTAIPAIIHGDLCFNNILFDMQSGVIKLIDPRGRFGTDTNTILGDSRYDLAKIRHSYCGGYDSLVERDFFLEIVTERKYTFRTNKVNHFEREKIFDGLITKYGYSVNDIRLIEAIHFLTMIPLHGDSKERQIAMWLTATMKLNTELIINDKNTENMH